MSSEQPSSVDRGDRTAGVEYADRLRRLELARWKQLLDVQAPYRLHLQRLRLGRVLEVGCGVGRNLAHLPGQAVGVDHNATSVAVARERGLEAYTTEEFLAGPLARPATFDSLLAAHLVEHLDEPAAREVLGAYLPYLREGGKVVVITPQERGYRTDATHVRFCGHEEVADLCGALGLEVVKQYSFPFLRPVGKVFPYNEFVTLARA